ncbi:YhbY family RNA-binding protein [Acinetobacter baumannii]|uniref:YhbY family RNA-binding protein n=1 Tax=Acinetobacter baumannii TaxID=470 RepID=UPI0034D751ED
MLKVSVLNNCLEDKNEVAEAIASGSGADIVQIIGSTIVLYKESKEHKTIELPR